MASGVLLQSRPWRVLYSQCTKLSSCQIKLQTCFTKNVLNLDICLVFTVYNDVHVDHNQLDDPLPFKIINTNHLTDFSS